MTRKTVTLNDLRLLPFPEVEKPEPVRAPIPKPPKVLHDPTRTPVNRQAAMLIASPSWLTKPLPASAPPRGELEKLREENTKLKATNEQIVKENSALRRTVERLRQMVRPSKPIIPEPPAPEPQPQRDHRLDILERLNHG